MQKKVGSVSYTTLFFKHIKRLNEIDVFGATNLINGNLFYVSKSNAFFWNFDSKFFSILVGP